MASASASSGNNSLLGQAKAVANAATAGPISELAKQIATNNQSNQQGQNTDFGYYMQLAQAAKDAVGQQQQIGAGLNSTLAGIGQNTQSQLAQFGQQAQGGALGRMNALGLAGDSPGQLQAETARQQGVGALNSQTFQDAGANQSANYGQNAVNTRGVVGLAGTEQIGNLARAGQLANEPLNAKIATLQDKKGALTETALGQLQKNQQAYNIAAAGLHIKAGTLANNIANDKARNQIAANRNQITAQNDRANQLLKAAGINVTRQNDAARNQNAANANSIRQNYDQGTLTLRAQAQAIKAGQVGVAKPLSTNENNTVNASIGRIIALIQEGQHPPAGQPVQSEAAIRQHLASGANPSKKAYAPVLIEAAYELLGYGSIDRTTAQALHQMGVRGTTYNGQPVKVTPDYTPHLTASPGQGAGHPPGGPRR